MTQNEEQLEQVEISIEQAKYNIGRKDSLINLTKNTDFKRLILEDYFKSEAARLVMVRAEPAMATDEHQDNINNALIAIGHLNQYLNAIMQMGTMAQRAMEADQDTREELLAEAN